MIIRISDSEAPAFTFVSPNETIECGEAIPTGVATAEDNCDSDVAVAMTETEKLLNCGYQIIRTFTATDECGNTATAQQVITVTDQTAPDLVGVPADLTVDAQAGDPVPDPANVTATDNCDQDVVVTLVEIQEDKDCGYLLIRTWTAEDNCGNTSQATQMIVVDEGCPCVEPVVEDVLTAQPTCGQEDGSITILVDGDEADFDYTWLPAKGTANADGNARSNLPSGTYTIVISDPASASCFTKVSVELKVDGTCIDTVYINIPAEDPFTVCVDNVLDLPGDVASASLCGYDDNAIEQIDLDSDSGCVTIDPEDSFTGETTICVIHCDDSNPAVCDTTYIVVKIDALVPCDDILPNAAMEVSLTDCDELADVCIDIPFAEIIEYDLTIDGMTYTGTLTSCDNGDGTMIQLGEGVHTIGVINSLTGCDDKQTIHVMCIDVTELVAVDDQVKTVKNQAIDINVLQNDIIPNNDLGDMYILSWPVNGDVKIAPDLKVTYTPDSDYCGDDVFAYVICNSTTCDTAQVFVDVLCYDIVVHNGFSPNNDGFNDYLHIDGVEAYPDNELHIYNRWGNQVFFQKGYKNNWNGTWDQGDLPDGTYFYIFKDGEGRVYNGFVQIQR